jgi:lipid-binding SYLF domain-containing protein
MSINVYNPRDRVSAPMLAKAAIVSMSLMHLASAVTAADLDKDFQQALQTRYKTEPLAGTLSRTTRDLFVFPNIVKAGPVFGGSYGEGELTRGSKVADCYSSVTGSGGATGRCSVVRTRRVSDHR